MLWLGHQKTNDDVIDKDFCLPVDNLGSKCIKCNGFKLVSAALLSLFLTVKNLTLFLTFRNAIKLDWKRLKSSLSATWKTLNVVDI